MSSSSSELEFEMEISSEEINQQHSIHEYAFGIMSSDSKGKPSIVGIRQPYTRSQSLGESSSDDDDHCEGFQSWSMSMYQSASRYREFHEGEEQNELGEDDNNNITTIASSAPSGGSFLRDYQRNSMKAFGSGAGSAGTGMRVNVLKQKPLLTRTWSASSLFGGGNKSSSSPNHSRCSLVDLDDNDTVRTLEPSKSWFSSLNQIPDKIRQRMADKNRLNLKSIPREKLKQLQCY